MNRVKYIGALIISKLTGRGNAYIIKKLREEGITIGKGTCIFSNINSSEPYLIEIGDNCTISTEVSFITHDASVGVFAGKNIYSDICGRIKVGNNCFIGCKAIILYGVSIPDNTIVAAGSVVSKTITEPGCIVGGNPAKVIGRVEDYLKKNENFFLSLHGLSPSDRKEKILNTKRFISR